MKHCNFFNSHPLSSFLKIFPEAFLGNSSMKVMDWGRLYFASFSVRKFSNFSWEILPETKRIGTYPHLASGLATRAHSLISGRE